MIIVDAHQDLAWNILTFDRNYARSAAETRELELGTDISTKNDDTLLGWPDFQKGQVALIFATLFVAPIKAKLGEWDAQHYEDANEANVRYNAQLDAYYRLVDDNPDKFQLVLDQPTLQEVLSKWKSEDIVADRPVGLIPLMEGAEGVRAPGELEEWWGRGADHWTRLDGNPLLRGDARTRSADFRRLRPPGSDGQLWIFAGYQPHGRESCFSIPGFVRGPDYCLPCQRQILTQRHPEQPVFV